MIEAEDLLKRYLASLSKNHPERGAVEALLKSAQAHNAKPEQVTDGITTETDPNKEWRRQAENLASLFAEPLDMSRGEYVEKLPQFPDKPQEYEGILDIPVIVQPPQLGLSLSRILDIAGINYDSQAISGFEDWERSGFKTPRRPYTTWLDDGSRFLGKTVEVARDGLASFERGGTHADGIGLYLKDPNILKAHYLDFPGSQFGSGSAPFLVLDGDEPWLLRYWVGSPDRRFGSVVAGREIRVGA